jgi:bifunctional UDP-N-acetylglucosamine pyrophosphorylase/glucosamine-1-phosphate N-acetyltransferase
MKDSNGVTIIDPETTYIEPNVKIGLGTIIYPGVIIEENSTIGKNCVIRGNTRIINSVIGNDCEIESAVIESSTVGNNCHIGPFAHLTVSLAIILKQEILLK